MATTTSRLALRKPANNDFKNFQTDLNDNYDKLDLAGGTVWGRYTCLLLNWRQVSVNYVIPLTTAMSKPDGTQIEDPFDFWNEAAPTDLVVPTGLGGFYMIMFTLNLTNRPIYAKSAQDIYEQANIQIYAPTSPFETFRRNFLSGNRNSGSAGAGWVTQASLTIVKRIDAGQIIQAVIFSDFNGTPDSINATGEVKLYRVSP